MPTNPYIAPQTFPQDFQFVAADTGQMSVVWYYFLFQFYQRFQTRIVAQSATASTAALTIDWNAGANVILTLSHNVTLSLINLPPSGQMGFMRFYVMNSGSFTIAWPAGTKWPSGTPPTLTSSGTDIIQLESINGGTNFYGTVIGQAYA